MGERKLVVDHLKFSYEGLFNVNEVYSVINTWFYEKGWDWYEKMNQESVTADGRQIRIVLEPWKSVSSFYKLFLHLKIHFVDVKEIEVEHQGENLRLSQGLIRITFDGYVMADRSGTWTEKPFYWLLTVMGQKYFFRDHFAKMEAWINSDVDDLHNKIKNYLNVFKYTYQT